MPAESLHLYLADRTHKACEHLLERNEEFHEWVVTTAFYEAVHLVEAMFAQCDSHHSERHKFRNEKLKREHAGIWRHFSKLYRHSLLARYLSDPANGQEKGSRFVRYLPPDKVKPRVIDGWLAQVRAEVDAVLAADKAS